MNLYLERHQVLCQQYFESDTEEIVHFEGVSHLAELFRGYVSSLNIFANNYFSNTKDKLYALWFDEIILQESSDIIKKVLAHIATEQGWSSQTFDEVSKIQVPVKKYLPEYQFLSNPWAGDDEKLIEAARKVTVEETLKKTVSDAPVSAIEHEIAWAGAGLIDAIQTWIILNTQKPCTFLPHQREAMVIGELFGKANKRGFPLFSEVILGEIPDFSHYSWDEVIELRQHPFFKAFRGKMNCLHRHIENEDTTTIREVLDEVVRRDMVNLINFVRPSPKKVLMKTVLSNIPLTIPINPFSVCAGVKDYLKECVISKKYGWLYFLFDLRNGQR